MFTFNENEMKTAKDIKDKASMTFAKRNKEFIESEQRKQTINNTVIGFDVLKYNEDYLNECIAKATPRLSKIKNVDKELDEIRGVEMTCKHYFEFVEWLFMREDHFFGKVENQKTLMFVNFAEGSKKKYTIEEVYDYWLKSVITTKDLTDDDQARAER
jgi:hypothetical protein